jgi:hypothetical protein
MSTNPAPALRSQAQSSKHCLARCSHSLTLRIRDTKSKNQHQRGNNHNAETHHDKGDGIKRAQSKHGELCEPIPDSRPDKGGFFLPKEAQL